MILIAFMLWLISLHSMKNISSNGGEFKSSNDEYNFIWDELSGASGDIPGDDILFYGPSFGPFHNNS